MQWTQPAQSLVGTQPLRASAPASHLQQYGPYAITLYLLATTRWAAASAW